MTASRYDAWSSGEDYEAYVGRWSRVVATRFVEWLSLPKSIRWLDLGCGTGALSDAILAASDPHEILGVDPSEAYIAYGNSRITDARVSFQAGDAIQLPADIGDFDAVVSGLALNFMPDPAIALSEMKRVLKPGGTIAAYVWDYAEGMEFMRYFWDASTELDPRALALDEGSRFGICRPDALRALFSSELDKVEVADLTIPTDFASFDDYWTPFLGGQGSAPGYVASLDDDATGRLRDLLKSRLPTDSDGRIRLTARAWAVRVRS